VELHALRRHTWTPGQLLAFSGLDGPTDYEHGLVARTGSNAVELEVVLPGRCRLRFSQDGMGDYLVAGDFLELQTAAGPVRAAFLDARHLLVEGPCAAIEPDDGLALLRRGERLLVSSAAAPDEGMLEADLDAALADRRSWLAGQTMPAGLPLPTRRAVAKALSQMKAQVCSPEGRIGHRWTTPDRWPHRALWLWDSAFHAIGWRHLDPGLAREMLLAVLDAQREDGFVPHMIRPDGSSAITQPPVLGLAAARIEALAPDRAWVREIYPRLCSYVEWDLANRDSDGNGLVEWQIEGNPHCRSGESGMDNSPRFDAATQLDAVDFNAFLANECEVLAGFARQLGRPAEAERWQDRHRKLCRLINQHLWSEEQGLYLDYDVDQDAPSPVLASSGFLPLLCGAPSATQAARLAAHLHDPTTFGTPLPVPSIAARDTAHYARDMWRGPVWLNVNWLIAAGFERYGHREEAELIRSRSLTVLEQGVERHGTFFEFYDDRLEVEPTQLRRKGKGRPEEGPYHQPLHDYGWTATLYLDLILTGARAAEPMVGPLD
jgi:putative isomerase